MEVDAQTYSPRHIDAIVTKEQSKNKWRFTEFYRHPETNKSEESWRLLEELSTRSTIPWFCIGDFNEIMHRREKEGGNTHPKWQMKNFYKAVNRCNLRDIEYTRLDFTWCRKLGTRGWVRERLDRALVSTNWASTFPNIRLHHVAASTLDHYMLVLKAPSDRQRRTRRKKLFMFKAM